MKKLVLSLLIFIGMAYSAYYADLDIDVDSEGYTTIQGSTNYPGLVVKDSSQYTSKKGEYWILNITKQGIFSEFLYSVELPEYSSINYAKSTGSVNIQNIGNKLIVKGLGENKEFSVVIQYKIEKKNDNYLLIMIGIVILVVIIFLFYIFNKKKNKKTNVEKQPKINMKNLPKRQKDILNLLLESKKPITQAHIQKELKLPKASVSRNINSLELKGLIEKENLGITNLIKLIK